MDEREVSEMQKEMMTVLVVEPMKAPYVKSIPNELEDLQQAVGGTVPIRVCQWKSRIRRGMGCQKVWQNCNQRRNDSSTDSVSYTHLRAHETIG